MLSRLGYGTFLFFGCMNALSAPLIYLFYPEPANRTLEEVNLLFTSDSPLVKKNMEAYRARLDAAGGVSAVAERRLFDEVNGVELEKEGHNSDAKSDKNGVESFAVEKV